MSTDATVTGDAFDVVTHPTPSLNVRAADPTVEGSLASREPFAVGPVGTTSVVSRDLGATPRKLHAGRNAVKGARESG